MLTQLENLLTKYQFGAVKVGIVESFERLQTIINKVREYQPSVFIVWDTVLSASSGFDFVNDIFRPMNVTYAKTGRSTYMAVYANWIKKYDTASDDFTWLPPSGFMAKVICKIIKFNIYKYEKNFNILLKENFILQLKIKIKVPKVLIEW